MTERAHDSYSASLGQLLAEVERLRAAANRAFLESVQPVEVPDCPDDLSRDMARLVDVLESARVSMLENPGAARALIEFLVAEGRRYAQSPDGRIWRNQLLGSPHLEYLRELWEAVTLDLFDHIDEEDRVPTAWVDLLTDALSQRSDVETLLSSLRPDGYR